MAMSQQNPFNCIVTKFMKKIKNNFKLECPALLIEKQKPNPSN